MDKQDKEKLLEQLLELRKALAGNKDITTTSIQENLESTQEDSKGNIKHFKGMSKTKTLGSHPGVGKIFTNDSGKLKILMLAISVLLFQVLFIVTSYILSK